MPPYSVITGATSGIGYELAKLLASKNHNLILVGRRASTLLDRAHYLKTEYQIAIETVVADLSEHNAVEIVADRLEQLNQPIEILVNNAGFGLYGSFSESDWEIELAMIHVNMIALTHLTKRVLAKMLSAGSGRILNISSTAAFRPGPMMAVYFASKAYVLSFTQAISSECKGTGVTATALCPGATDTRFAKTAGLDSSQFLKGKRILAPSEVAEYAYTKLMAGAVIAIPGWQNRMISKMLRFLPGKLINTLSMRVKNGDRSISSY